MSPLSPREAEVLVVMATGVAGKTAAVRLGCSEQTIKNHLSSIYAKLDVPNLVSALGAMGWIHIDEAWRVPTLERRIADLRMELEALGADLDAIEARQRVA